MSVDLKAQSSTSGTTGPEEPMPSRFTFMLGLSAIAFCASAIVTSLAGLVFGLALGAITCAAARRELRVYRELGVDAGVLASAAQGSEAASPTSFASVWMARSALALGFVATLPVPILIIFIFVLAALNQLD